MPRLDLTIERRARAPFTFFAMLAPPLPVVLALGLVLLSSPSAGLPGAEEPRSRPPDILLFISDDSSWHDFGCYGNSQISTPNIDRLAREGLRFTHCFTATAMCSPTRQQLYTGVFPVRNGAWPNHSHVREGTRSICHHLSALGYRVGIAGKRHIGPAASFPFEGVGGGNLDFAAIERWLVAEPERPACLVVASHEPHGPYTKGSPERYDPARLELPAYLVDTPGTRRTLAAYYAELTTMDGQVGRCREILERTGRAERAIFLYTSEQGSGFPGAKWTCYDAGLRTALVVRWPGRVKPGSVSHAMVEYVDLLPTLVEAAGGDPKAIDTGLAGAPGGGRGFDGRSFLAVLEGRRGEHRDTVFGVHTTRGIIAGSECYPVRSIRTRTHHLILNLNAEKEPFRNIVTERDRVVWGSWVEKARRDPAAARLVARYRNRPPVELYDVVADPDELHNLALEPDPAARERIAKLRRRLLSWMESQGDRGNATELEAFSRQGRGGGARRKGPRRDRRGKGATEGRAAPR